MPTFECDLCGKKFEALKKRRFCSPEHRNKAFANLYVSLPPSTGYEGNIIVKAPKLGWVRNSEYMLPSNEKMFQVKVKVGPDGYVRPTVLPTKS
jgi:hypothetical protein